MLTVSVSLLGILKPKRTFCDSVGDLPSCTLGIRHETFIFKPTEESCLNTFHKHKETILDRIICGFLKPQALYEVQKIMYDEHYLY